MTSDLLIESICPILANISASEFLVNYPINGTPLMFLTNRWTYTLVFPLLERIACCLLAVFLLWQPYLPR
ncbi:MAG: hypothetical protein VW390_09360, partial [Gammaproteobacteria bacterium]